MFLTSRTPLRVSFFGGGTDYPDYFDRSPGAVIGMAIDKYIYISALKLNEIVEYKYRVSYRTIERRQTAAEIEHPVVRAVLQRYGVEFPLDIGILADLPASSGLGSSSAFTVGMVNLVMALQGTHRAAMDLAAEAIHLERAVLNEIGGIQDQLHAAFGGINRFDFAAGQTTATPVDMAPECRDAFLGSLFLVYTGSQRSASEVSAEQAAATTARRVDNHLSHLLRLTDDACRVLSGRDPDRLVAEFGAMMHDGWMTKRQLSSRVSTPDIDRLYDAARAAGGLGGKLCGAGGGGFLLMVVPPGRDRGFRDALRDHAVIKVGLAETGSFVFKG